MAHKAAKEARIAVDTILGESSASHEMIIPAVVFTDPEVAWCGLTEAEAKQRNIPFEVSKFSWAASGRALSFDRTDGLTKLIVDPETGLRHTIEELVARRQGCVFGVAESGAYTLALRDTAACTP